ncbi:MAG: hypothetical protein M3P18_25265, partial [Actinomycetota bacterium]|nr:hypothetical protein [Actinomycetota bacterium]
YDLGAVVGGMQITAGQEGVFVVENANKATIAQLDPQSPALIREFSGRKYRRLLVGGGSLWTGSCGGSVMRIDPSTLHETATIPVIQGPGPPDFKCQDPLLFAQHALWVLTGQHRLSRLDPKTQAVTQNIHVPFAYTEGSSQNVASSRGRIWTTYSNELDGRIRIEGADTRTGRVVVSRRGRNVSPSNDLNDLQGRITAIAANRRYVWLAGPNSVLWLDPSTLRVVRTTKVNDPTGLVVVGNSLWVVEGTRSGGAVQRISISGRARRSSPSTPAQYSAPSFSRAPGWYTKTTGTVSASSYNEPIATAANVSLKNDHNLYGYPRGILASLPPDGVLISAAMLMPDKFPARPGPNFPQRALPLQLSQAQRQSYWETQPAKNVPQFLLLGVVKRQYVDVRVFFGTQHPSLRTLQAAQQELNNLRIPDR